MRSAMSQTALGSRRRILCHVHQHGRVKLRRFEEINEEVGQAIASADGGEGEVQEQECGTADKIIMGMREIDAIVGNSSPRG